MAGFGIPVAGIASGLLGAYETYMGLKGLRELQKNKPSNYTVSPELQKSYARAEGMTGIGFTGAEKGAFQQNLATAQNTALGSAVNAGGGNLAQTLAMGLQGQNIGAINKFAADDALIRRDNIKYADSLMDKIQSQKNLATQQSLLEFQQKQQAYGGAVKAGLENLGGAFNLNNALNYDRGIGTATARTGGVGGIGNIVGSTISPNINVGDPNFGFQLDNLNEEQARTAYASHTDPKVLARLEELYPFLTQ